MVPAAHCRVEDALVDDECCAWIGIPHAEIVHQNTHNEVGSLMYPGKWAELTPDKPAVINSETGAAIGFRELDRRSNRLARLFRERGLRPGDHIAMFLENDIRFFEAAWAALRSGLYLTTVNRYLSAEEAAYIVNDCGARALISSRRLAAVAREMPVRTPNCDLLLALDGVDGFEDFDEARDQHPPEPLQRQPRGEFMFYSSGTTGRPKGIEHRLSGTEVSDRNDTYAFHANHWGFDTNTVFLSPAPLYHAAPAVLSVSTQAHGGTSVIMPTFDASAALAAMEIYRVNRSQWVPTMFVRLLRLPAAERARYDLSSHRFAVHAAAPCPVEVKKQMLDWWGPIIHEYYAGSEQNGSTHVGPEEWLKYPGTVGKPIFGTLHICDDDGIELPVGEVGTIYFEQAKPFRYHNDAEKTFEAQHPLHANWTSLGDVGYVNDEGYLFLVDRKSFTIISGGVNIYPQEIEDALILHPKVMDVAVIGVPNEEMGEEVKAVVQLTEGVAGSAAVEQELVAYARLQLAHYKCPRSFDFVDELPRLPTGKLYKDALKDRYWRDAGGARRI